MKTLLEKMRAMNDLIQKSAGQPVDFKEMGKALSEHVEANCYIIGCYGEVLGYAFSRGRSCDTIDDILYEAKCFPEDYAQSLEDIKMTKANVAHKDYCVLSNGRETCVFGNKVTTYIPMIGGAEKLGTVVLSKFDQWFSDGDLVLAEYGATVIAMEMLRAQSEKSEEIARLKAMVHVATQTLSYSEAEAIVAILRGLEGNEGVIVASKIADEAGITRSVIVNALRKFESAGVINSKSLGMKGTYIRVLNSFIWEELDKMSPTGIKF
ncbi:GTP-sensing pleiotropic transcriptional regulator CodY [Metallumcola ferriviriculae]|uniref:Global transcriptional regulator CodY n=1 Tax=Metallumcola ferriviriculae TaxID=3039180 RepID=A0AAU0UPS9_9FIRM|nr:GTP-sensing pleiotropic transcriptional regulator CodY [Desulfitibacteraceae bacterium MK1]